MTFVKWNRVIHRWTSIVFIIAVLVATYAAATGMDQTSILYYLPLPPLFLQMATGMIMFVLHYAHKARGRQTAI